MIQVQDQSKGKDKEGEGHMSDSASTLQYLTES